MAAIESRFLRPTRAGLKAERREQQPATIEGYGAVFYKEGDPATEYELYQDTYERIMPGAFDEIGDVKSLFNHDPNWVLGRNTSNPKTLELSVDEVGLKYKVLPPDTQAVRDQVLAPIERGDVDGSSFMFYILKRTWVEENRDGRTVYVRQVDKVQLLEVGPVTFPAYQGTSAGLRSTGLSEEETRSDAQANRPTSREDSSVCPSSLGPGDVDAACVEVSVRNAQMLADLELLL